MILEVAVLNIKSGQSEAFEAAFKQASPIIAEAHTIGFRESVGYQEWKRLLHHFYSPFPTVEHYEQIALSTDQV
jgi:heme-degrading monooxygenase HmoA